MIIVPQTASAANSVIDSDPCPNSSTALQPSRVTVAFSDDLPPSGATMVVRDSNGDDITNGVFSIEGNNIYADLPYPLPKGHYTAYYRVKDSNGTPFGGQFNFEYGNSNKLGNCPKPAGKKARGGEKTWRGANNIPEVVALPTDADTPTTEPTSEPTVSPNTAARSDDITALSSDSDSDKLPWIAGGLTALLVAAALLLLLLRKRRA